MNNILILAGALIALRLMAPMMRVLIASVAGKQIGAAALAKQPDTIHLTPTDANAWQDRAAVGALAGSLRPLGFADAGIYKVPELPGICVRLLALSEQSFYAAIYEHPKVGVWCELFTRYADGTSATFSNGKPTGMNPRPGHTITNMPGKSVPELFARATSTRPQGVFRPHTTDAVVRDFENAFAESMAWRKGNGVSTGEVVKVAMKRVA